MAGHRNKPRGRITARQEPFDFRGAVWLARRALQRPVAKQHIERHDGHGVLIAYFALPLTVAPPMNRHREIEPWALEKLKKSCLQRMQVQLILQRRETPAALQAAGVSTPLPGRPQVRAIRFSSVEPDKNSAWSKIIVDRLTGKHGGLGLIQDDKPELLEERDWWEPCAAGEGFVYLELWSGAAPSKEAA